MTSEKKIQASRLRVECVAQAYAECEYVKWETIREQKKGCIPYHNHAKVRKNQHNAELQMAVPAQGSCQYLPHVDAIYCMSAQCMEALSTPTDRSTN